MKNLTAVLVLLIGSVARAEFMPVAATRAIQPSRLIDVRERTALEIKARAEAGYHYASVDMDGATWKEEKQIKRELQALGYDVDFGNDHHVYGWNALNGALVIRWK